MRSERPQGLHVPEPDRPTLSQAVTRLRRINEQNPPEEDPSEMDLPLPPTSALELTSGTKMCRWEK